ncbi:MAG: UDP-N-acetylglucosamine--N-acetylmuramyl-(pentapeptide) pyrophosphoryl-undecaprenol N-acetylglucosamine transferase [Fervidobacterium sp.]
MNHKKKLKIVAAGGVTGGHLYPNIAVLEEFQKHYDIEVLYFCVKGKIEEKILPKIHPEFQLFFLDLKGLRRPIFHPANVVRLTKLIINSNKLLKKIKEFSPDFAYVSGGYVSYPVARSSHKLGIPVFVQEQNTLPGKANIAISKFAKRIFLSFEEAVDKFPQSVREKIEVTGNPIWLREGKVDLKHPTVIVVGGSGGSEFLNKITLEIAREMPDVHFILSTGKKELYLSQGEVPENIEIKSYIDNMYAYWRSVDAAITRAGATTISELIYFNVPAIIVPWEGSTESHQVINASIIEKQRLGIMVRENDYNKKDFVDKLRNILKQGRELKECENPASKIVKSISKILKV